MAGLVYVWTLVEGGKDLVLNKRQTRDVNSEQSKAGVTCCVIGCYGGPVGSMDDIIASGTGNFLINVRCYYRAITQSPTPC